jgi:uncharacterized protein (DUF983 family)
MTALLHRKTRHNARSNHDNAFDFTQSVPVIAVFLIMAHISVALRLWTRARIRKSVGWDDYTIIASLVSAIRYRLGSFGLLMGI